MNIIISYSIIKNTESLKDFYKNLKIDYPKFYKMDKLSQLCFLNAEVLFREIKKENYKSTEIGIVLANSSSSLATDNDYFKTIEDENNYFPSPVLFTYTLPNISMAEVCIRHKIQGENAFFVLKEMEFSFIAKYVNNLLNINKIKACVVGWNDYCSENFESFLMFVEKDINGIEFSLENIKNKEFLDGKID